MPVVSGYSIYNSLFFSLTDFFLFSFSLAIYVFAYTPLRVQYRLSVFPNASESNKYDVFYAE